MDGCYLNTHKMASCMTPYTIKPKWNDKNSGSVAVPCGKCPACCARRISGWSFRLMQECNIASSSYFLTLTYDTKYVPITKAGFLSLEKAELQKFFKRLRRAHDLEPEKLPAIKYFAVGEYGGQTKRPHYHLILFNAFADLVQPAWNKGHVHFGGVTDMSVGYTLKYMHKGPWRPMHRNDDREGQFSLMSKGLGKSYMTEEMLRWHLTEPLDRMYCNLLGGKKICMPRYYKQKIYGDELRKEIGKIQLLRMTEKEFLESANRPENYERDRYEGIAAAMRAASFKATKGDKL